MGKSIRRREDPRLITGTATYVEDIELPDMHYAAVLRSPYPAAKINGIDTQEAAKHPGVVAVFTGKDIDHLGPVPCGISLPDLKIPHHHLLAQDRVYYVGHPVAVVVARDRYIAADAVDLVEVEYESTPSVSDPEKALEEGAPAVHAQWPDNVGLHSPSGRRRH